MPAIIYASATEHINKYPYPVMTQAHFAGMHKEVEDGIFFAPIYESSDYKQKQRSAIPISKMVELYTAKSSFDIIEDKDVLSILHHIDAYVEEVYPMRVSHPEIAKYIESILKLRERVYTIFRRVLNKHPQWKNAYEGPMGVFQVISKLYNSLNLGIKPPETLLEELRICPTIRQYQQSDNNGVEPIISLPGEVVYDV